MNIFNNLGIRDQCVINLTDFAIVTETRLDTCTNDPTVVVFDQAGDPNVVGNGGT